MGKRERQAEKQSRRERRIEAVEPMGKPAYRKEVKLSPKNEAQGHYLISMESNQLTFGLGPAGVGKTYLCTMLGIKLLEERRINKLIVTRPAIEAGRGMGFLPGTIEEKFAPYFAPFKAILEQQYGPSHLENLIKNGRIEIAPLEYIRGLTFDDAFVILDEAQNTTPTQMKLFLTRLGEYSRVVVNGDLDQKDIEGYCGLDDAVHRLRTLDKVGVVEFDEDDVVRSGLVKDILKRYRD